MSCSTFLPSTIKIFWSVFELQSWHEIYFKQEGQDGPVSLSWLPDKFRVNWPFDSREVQYRFSRLCPSWISNHNEFSYFWSTSNEVLSQLAFWFRIKNFKTDFQLGRPSLISDQDDFSYFWDWISNQNKFSYLWSTSHPDTSYQVSSQLAFQFRRRSTKQISKMAAMASWISDQKNFSYFWSTSHPDASYQVSSQLAFLFRRRREK